MGSAIPILKVLLPIAIGIVLVQTGIFEMEDSRRIRKLCVRFTIPLMVFASLYKAELTVLNQVPPMMMALVLATSAFFALGWLAGARARDPGCRTAVHACITFGNYGWIGWAASHVFYGQAGLDRSIFFTLLFWPALYIYGLPIGMIHVGREDARRGWRLALGMAAPSIGALALGAGLNYLDAQLPGFVFDTIKQFGDMTVPLILLSVGIQLEFRSMRRHVAPAAVVTAARCLVGPGIGILTLWAVRAVLGCDTASAEVILLQSAMPVATLTPILADNYRMDLNAAGAAIVLSTLVSLVTIPIWIELIPRIM